MRYLHFFCLVMLFINFYFSTVYASQPIKIPILTYHNFDPHIPGSMTISPKRFEEQLKWLKNNGYTVIPMKDLVSYLRGKEVMLPEKPVVITADDGRKSVYTYMLPIIRQYQVPVTLFIYPTAISNASYTLSWKELQELQATGLFDIQGHTYWHPDFNVEKKNLSSPEYQKLVRVQLLKSKQLLEDKLHTPITLLAWPYGIYNRYLEEEATKAGYVMAFSVDDRHANRAEKSMAQPRYTITAKHSMKTFKKMMSVGFK